MSARFPRGATFDIVCPKYSADWKGWSSHNVKNGTSAVRGQAPPPYAVPPAPFVETYMYGGGWWAFRIPNSEFPASCILHPNPIVEITHE